MAGLSRPAAAASPSPDLPRALVLVHFGPFSPGERRKWLSLPGRSRSPGTAPAAVQHVRIAVVESLADVEHRLAYVTGAGIDPESRLALMSACNGLLLRGAVADACTALGACFAARLWLLLMRRPESDSGGLWGRRVRSCAG